jgi:hypothetical protein
MQLSRDELKALQALADNMQIEEELRAPLIASGLVNDVFGVSVLLVPGYRCSSWMKPSKSAKAVGEDD